MHSSDHRFESFYRLLRDRIDDELGVVDVGHVSTVSYWRGLVNMNSEFGSHQPAGTAGELDHQRRRLDDF